jgi:hypothetical protein
VVLGEYAREQAAGWPPSFGGAQAAHDTEVVQTVGVDDDDFGILRIARPRVTHAKRAGVGTQVRQGRQIWTEAILGIQYGAAGMLRGILGGRDAADAEAVL